MSTPARSGWCTRKSRLWGEGSRPIQAEGAPGRRAHGNSPERLRGAPAPGFPALTPPTPPPPPCALFRSRLSPALVCPVLSLWGEALSALQWAELMNLPSSRSGALGPLGSNIPPLSCLQVRHTLGACPGALWGPLPWSAVTTRLWSPGWPPGAVRKCWGSRLPRSGSPSGAPPSRTN